MSPSATWSRRTWLREIQARCTAAGECWVWRGAVNRLGAPRWNPGNGVHVMVHRKAWEAVNAPIPQGHVLVNLCGEPRCCRPAHYQCLTKGEQMRRSLAAGGGAQGVMLGLAVARSWRRRAGRKMDLQRAEAMRARRAQAPAPSIDALAQEFGVSRSTAWLVVTGQRWAAPSPWGRAV